MSKSQQPAQTERAPAEEPALDGPSLAAVENSVRADELASEGVEEEAESSLLDGPASEAPVPMDAGAAAPVGSTVISAVNEVTYSFEAADLTEAVAQMKAGAPQKGEFGQLRWNPNWDWSDNGKGRFAKSNVTLEMQKTMPEWSNVGDASAAEQKEWRRFYKALDVHEDGHAEIATTHFTDLGTAIGGMKVAEGKKKWADTVAANNAAQIKYDGATSHGQTQGTDITIPAAPEKKSAGLTEPLLSADAEDPPKA